MPFAEAYLARSSTSPRLGASSQHFDPSLKADMSLYYSESLSFSELPADLRRPSTRAEEALQAIHPQHPSVQRNPTWNGPFELWRTRSTTRWLDQAS